MSTYFERRNSTIREDVCLCPFSLRNVTYPFMDCLSAPRIRTKPYWTLTALTQPELHRQNRYEARASEFTSVDVRCRMVAYVECLNELLDLLCFVLFGKKTLNYPEKYFSENRRHLCPKHMLLGRKWTPKKPTPACCPACHIRYYYMETRTGKVSYIHVYYFHIDGGSVTESVST